MIFNIEINKMKKLIVLLKKWNDFYNNMNRIYNIYFKNLLNIL